jgi:3-dehydroquinate synthetase
MALRLTLLCAILFFAVKGFNQDTTHYKVVSVTSNEKDQRKNLIQEPIFYRSKIYIKDCEVKRVFSTQQRSCSSKGHLFQVTDSLLSMATFKKLHPTKKRFHKGQFSTMGFEVKEIETIIIQKEYDPIVLPALVAVGGGIIGALVGFESYEGWSCQAGSLCYGIPIPLIGVALGGIIGGSIGFLG